MTICLGVKEGGANKSRRGEEESDWGERTCDEKGGANRKRKQTGDCVEARRCVASWGGALFQVGLGLETPGSKLIWRTRTGDGCPRNPSEAKKRREFDTGKPEYSSKGENGE